MPVYDRSYRRWDGELSRRTLRFVPIVTMGVRNALATKGGWFFTLLLRAFMVVSIVPTLLLFFANYALVYKPGFLPRDFLDFLDVLKPFRAIQHPLLTRFNISFLAVYTMLFGSGLIAKDRASGALPLYLSRPLTLTDYVLGKVGIIGWFIAAFTLAPNLLLWIFGVAADDSGHALRDALPSLGPIVAQNLTVIAVYSLTILAVSSLCRRPMFAGLIWFAVVVLLPSFTAVIATRLGLVSLRAIAPNEALYGIGHHLFDVAELSEQANQQASAPTQLVLRPIFEVLEEFGRTPPGWCWLSAAAWCTLSLAIVLVMLRRQDVAGDSARR